MIKNKKGLEQAVSWVLLIGFSVALATFVGFWLRQQAENAAESVTDETIRKTRCTDTLISGTCIQGSPGELTITNRGSFRITQIRCRDDAILRPVNIIPSASRPIPLSSCTVNNNMVRVSPFIRIGERDEICAEQTIDIKCQ